MTGLVWLTIEEYLTPLSPQGISIAITIRTSGDFAELVKGV